jgi:OmpA-OmpF porin, OOP family
MKMILATTCIAAVSLLAGGCATKKYVRNTVETSTQPIQAKVDQVDQKTTQNGQQIQQTQTDLKAADERATNGINAAKESASAADAHAGDAMNRANQVGQTADQAVQASSKNSQELGSLRGVITNLDDYQLQSSVSIPFDFDKYTLTDEAKASLDKLAADVKADKRYFIALEGFTDNIGAKEYNEALSRRRADSVERYLVEHEVPLYRVHMIGLGDVMPVEEGRTREARAKNRRVEVKVYSADQATAPLNASK